MSHGLPSLLLPISSARTTASNSSSLAPSPSLFGQGSPLGLSLCCSHSTKVGWTPPLPKYGSDGETDDSIGALRE